MLVLPVSVILLTAASAIARPERARTRRPGRVEPRCFMFYELIHLRSTYCADDACLSCRSLDARSSLGLANRILFFPFLPSMSPPFSLSFIRNVICSYTYIYIYIYTHDLSFSHSFRLSLSLFVLYTTPIAILDQGCRAESPESDKKTCEA